jgi:hypothetical protein
VGLAMQADVVAPLVGVRLQHSGVEGGEEELSQ